MKTKTLITLTLLSITLLITSCSNSNFKTTDSGLIYRLVKENPDSSKLKAGDVVALNIKYTNEKGITLFDSNDIPNYKMIVKKPKYKASIDEGIIMMHVGDSAIFKVDAANFYMLSLKYKELPDEVKNGGNLIFYVKILKKVSSAELKKEKEKLLKNSKKHEEQLLSDYLYKENITQKPTPSGMYYIEKKEGNGKKPKNGDKIIVHYTGKFINGEIFDSSIKSGKPLTYIVGTKGFIPGWNEGISHMKEGGEAKFIIPSHLAYGSKKQGPIPPYSTLIFEVELIKVIPANTQKNKK
jgi:peptidylprolyl isomerase